MLPLATQYKEEVFKPMTRTIKRIGEALGPRVSPKAIDVSPYQGVADTVQRKIPKTIPRGVSDIGTVTTPYRGKTRYEDIHKGIDYTRGIGSPVQSWTRGKVSEVVTGKVKGSPAYGNFVIVTDEQGNRHRYSHLQGGYVPFSVGQQIQRGDILGLEGATGQTYSLHGGTGAHVDYRILSAAKKYLDPYIFINK